MAIIVGKYELDKKLDKIKDIDLTNAIKKSCMLVEASAKEKCPAHIGDLRNSITSEVDKNEGRVGTNMEYAPYVHQGTGIYAVNGDGRQTPWKWFDASGDYRGGEPGWVTTVGQEPQPFLEDAFNENKDKIDDFIVDAIKEALSK